MALVPVTALVPEEFAETAVAYMLEHVAIQLRERQARAAVEAVAPEIDAAIQAVLAANAPAVPETPAGEG